MPFIPHTPTDIEQMLKAIGVRSTEELFDEIPPSMMCSDLPHIPVGMTEQELMRHARELSQQNHQGLCFIGAGAYEHHIPAAVWDITARGEFLTGYAPYQPEASQGTLQLLYEYQTMMASLVGLDVSNASLYDGASALAESVLMAVRLHKKAPMRVLVMGTLHPHYRDTVRTIVSQQKIEVVEVPLESDSGRIEANQLQTFENQEFAAVVIPQPNFFGVLEDVDMLTRWAKKKNALAIACVNPMAMALLKEPGQWGDSGVDMACGDGQPLGIPLASGGPYFGFITTREEHVRQMPGRIIGRTIDVDGKTGFTMTLQAREQHIRRAKATSNICTNQGLLVTAATIYMSLVGPTGLKNVALRSHQQTRLLVEKLTAIKGVSRVFSTPFFHEVVLRFNRDAADVLRELAKRGIQGGFDLTPYHPKLKNCVLVCATETKTDGDLDRYAAALQEVLA